MTIVPRGAGTRTAFASDAASPLQSEIPRKSEAGAAARRPIRDEAILRGDLPSRAAAGRSKSFQS
jgi:hypothetical protein